MILKNNINPQTIDLLIYDVDGTLVEFKTLYKLLKESFQIFGIEYKNEYFKEYLNSVSNALNVNEKDFCFNKLSNCFEKKFAICREYGVSGREYLSVLLNLEYKYTSIIDGVKETLPYLNNNYQQVVSTNWFKDSQIVKLDKYELCKYFKEIYSCEEVYPKPNEKHFQMISDNYMFDHNRCLVIGDSSSDMEAYYYGYNTLLVDYRNSKKDLYHCSDAVVTDFGDIKKVLEKK